MTNYFDFLVLRLAMRVFNFFCALRLRTFRLLRLSFLPMDSPYEFYVHEIYTLFHIFLMKTMGCI